MRTDRPTDMEKLRVVSRKFANAPKSKLLKNVYLFCCLYYYSHILTVLNIAVAVLNTCVHLIWHKGLVQCKNVFRSCFYGLSSRMPDIVAEFAGGFSQFLQDRATASS